VLSKEFVADLGPENAAGDVSVASVVAGLPMLCRDEQLSWWCERSLHFAPPDNWMSLLPHLLR
jgi:hypothetical protein